MPLPKFDNLEGTSNDSFQIGVTDGPLLQRVAATARLQLSNLLRWLPGGSAIAGYLHTDTSGDATIIRTNYTATTNPTVNDDGSLSPPYSRGSLWINTVTNRMWACLNASVGAAVWRPIGEDDTSVGSRSGIDISFYTSSTPYIEVNSTSPQVIGRFTFPGTSATNPSSFKLIGSRNAANGTATVDIFDLTNGNVVGQINYTSSTITIYTDTTLVNLPTGEAIFEMRAYKSGGGASNVRVHFVSVR
jgi:hypothetical protein